MNSTTRTQRTYDHRLRELVRSTGDIEHATRHGVPRSTARGWLVSDHAEVVSVDVVDKSVLELQEELLRLRARVDQLRALLQLFIALFKVSAFSLDCARLRDGSRKLILLRAIERSRSALPLRVALRVLRLSHSRYHSWKRDEECGLDDQPSCPRSSPQQLTREEVAKIREMVTSDEYRHVPTGTLAVLAQRLGRVFASSATWYRLVRIHKWRRLRKRIHPSKPKLGIRAAAPDEIWHIDTTVIRLLDGTRVYLRAVIDNFSRRILAWKVFESFDAEATAELLLTAAKHLRQDTPNLLVDGGIENFNRAVDRLIDTGVLKRILAQTDISFSNSMIESWWRSLKTQWLHLNTLDTASTIDRLVGFYVAEHNTRIPHSAFRGQTPDEMYFGTGDHIPDELNTERAIARLERLDVNRSTTCSPCEPVGSIADLRSRRSIHTVTTRPKCPSWRAGGRQTLWPTQLSGPRPSWRSPSVTQVNPSGRVASTRAQNCRM